VAAYRLMRVNGGWSQMSQGFSVTPFVLQVGSQDVASLQDTCQAIAQDVAGTLTAMADSAGHQGLSAALTRAAGQGNRAFTTMWAAYGHTSQGLASSAQNYLDADQSVVSSLGLFLGDRLRMGLQP
jgi:uncharacterized protein YukE